MMMSEKKAQLHPNPNFPNFIRKTLERTNLKDIHIDKLTNTDSLIEFTKVFTRVSIDPLHNNEFYEIIGDTSTNKIVVDYFANRFIHLFGSGSAKKGEMGPVAIMARLKQKYISKTIYSKFAEKLGFWEYVRRTEEENKDKTRMCEDAFEAFMGCLEKLCNKKIGNFTGFAVITNVMYPLLDELDIKESDLTMKSLYDFKSQLNNLSTLYRPSIEIKYNTVTNEVTEENYMNRFSTTLQIMDLSNGKIYSTPPFNWSLKTESENLAAQYALEHNYIDKIVKEQEMKGLIKFETNVKGNLVPKRVGLWSKYSFGKATTLSNTQISNFINSILMNENDVESIKAKLTELKQFL